MLLKRLASLLVLVILGVVALGLPPRALAQNITGTIIGTVTDASGASVPNAAVTVTELQTATSSKTTTNDLGYYTVPYLKPGTYRIEVSKTGFETVRREEVNVQVDSRVVLDFKLTVGSTATTVSVVGQQSQVETSTSSLGQVISAKTTQELPIMGRNIFDLVNISAGVQVNPVALSNTASAGTNSAPLFVFSDISINGGRFRTNDFLVDGVSVMLPENNDYVLAPTVDEVSDFKVLTNGPEPQFGRSGGGVIDVVTRGGTNQWHGVAYDYGRNGRLDSVEYFANASGQKKGPFNFDLYGGAVGGPIVKNKTFVFGTFEGSRDHSTNPGQLITLPTAAERSGDFSQDVNGSGAAITIYDPYTTSGNGTSGYSRSAFQGNIIPMNEIDSTALKVLKYIPLPNLPGSGPAHVNNYVWAQNLYTKSDQWSARIDHRISDRQTLFARASRNVGGFGNSGQFNDPADNVLGNDVSRALSFVLNDTLTLSPTSFLNLRYGLTRRYEGRQPTPVQGPFDNTTLGFPASVVNAEQQKIFPGFNFTSYSAWGDVGGNSIRRGNSVNSFVGDMTKIHGRHTIIFGADVRLYNQTPYQAGSPAGSFAFNNSWTQGPNPLTSSLTAGDSFASFLLGYGSGSVTEVPALALQNWYWAGYVNDTIKWHRLTVNAGMRYDHLDPWTERYNRLTDFNFTEPFPIQVAGMPNLVGSMIYAGQNGVPRGDWNGYWKSFQPRVGVAYELNSKTALRADYGIFYPPHIGTTSGQAFGDSGVGGQLTTTWVASLNGVTPLNALSNAFPSGLAKNPTSQAGILGLGTPLSVMDRQNTDNSYIQQWNFSIQYQPAANWLVEVAYVGNKGTHLPMQINFDQMNPSNLSLGSKLTTQVANPFYGLVPTGTLSTPTVAQSQLLLPYPQYTSVSTGNPPLQQNEAISDYSALELTVEHRFSHGMSSLVTYTNGKNISNGSGRVFHYADSYPVENIYNLQAERSIDDGDISQRLVVTHVVELPFGRGKALLGKVSGPVNQIIGGWSLSGILSLNTGFPLALSSSGTTDPGAAVQRPNVVAGVNPKLSGSVESRLKEYFNTAAYSLPASYTFGNASRTTPTVRGPGRQNYNVSLEKRFQVKEPVAILFRAEAFNLTNTPSFGPPGLALGSSTFGVISSTGAGGFASIGASARAFQLALKVEF